MKLKLFVNPVLDTLQCIAIGDKEIYLEFMDWGRWNAEEHYSRTFKATVVSAKWESNLDFMMWQATSFMLNFFRLRQLMPIVGSIFGTSSLPDIKYDFTSFQLLSTNEIFTICKWR